MAKYAAEPNRWGGDSTQWQALSDKPVRGSRDLFPAATVTYDHEGEELHSERLRDMTGQMYQHFPGQITEAFADKSMRQHIPTLLGLAAQQHQRLAGRSDALPQASDDLSVHSAGMIAHLQAKGIPVATHPENADAHVTNDHKLGSYALVDHPDVPRTTLDTDTVKSGRDLMRGMLRSSRVSSKQFPHAAGEQGKLF